MKTLSFVLICLASGCQITWSTGVPVTIVNQLGGWSIHYVHISRTDTKGWGPDMLGDSEIIRPGGERVFRVPEGTWNIRVTDSDGDTYTRNGVIITSGGYTWEVTLEDLDFRAGQAFPDIDGNCPITFSNGLNIPLDSLWLSPSDHGYWGTNRLHESMAPHTEYILWIRQGTYDLRAMDGIGTHYSVYNGEVTENGFYWEITGDYAEHR
jgi:hypothetical protein